MNLFRVYRWGDLPWLAGLTVAYALLAKAGLTFFSSDGIVTPIWLPSGLALAALLLGGKKYWPGILIGAFIGGLIVDNPFWVAVFLALANTMESLLCAWLLSRFAHFDAGLAQLRDYLSLCLAGAVGSSASALIGAITLIQSGLMPSHEFAYGFAQWWQGDLLGIVLITPLIIVWRTLPQDWLQRERLPETLTCFGLAFLAGQIVFLGWFDTTLGAYAKGYLMFAFVAWAAISFGRHGALLVIAMTTVHTLLGIAHGAGYFGKDVAETHLVGFWLYMLVFSIVGNALALFAHALRQAESALRENEQSVRTMNETVPEQIWTARPDGTLDYVNRRVTEFFGRPFEAMIENGWKNCIHPEDLPETLRRWTEALQTGQPYETEFRLRHHSGDYLWHIGRALPLRDNKDTIIKWYGANTDITERKKLEQQQTSRLRHLDVMDRITQASATDDQVEHMLMRVLDEVLQTFQADRAWFLYPCDPDALSWGVPMERTKPEWPGLFSQGVDMPMTAEVSGVFNDALTAKGPVQYGPAPCAPLPASISAQFSVQSQLQMVLRPKVGAPWLFGLHHCSHAHLHSDDDLHLFTEIAQRVTESLSSLISLSNLHQSEEKFRNLFQNAPVGVFHASPEGQLLLANPALSSMLGYDSPDEMVATISNIGTQVYADEHKRKDNVDAILKHDGWIQLDSLFVHRNGEHIPVKIRGRKVLNRDSTVAYLEGFVEDLTEQKLSAETIWKQANFDALTHLPNRRLFHDRLQQEVKKANRGGYSMALLFIDLDRFKEVNDTLGHDAGDLLLIEAARRISRCVRDSDTVARLGGDEFTIILPELGDPNHVDHVAQNIINTLCEPFTLNDETVYISASIGITFYPDDADAAENLLKNADQAMYVAKDAGRNRYSHFTQTLQETAQQRQRMIRDLRTALADNQFLVNFQPVVELKTGRIVKAEALIRWRHPERGMVGPNEFIPLTEETGLIVDIGKWVFMESARWIKQWAELCPHGLQISVNKSPTQFHAAADDSHEEWLDYLKELGLSGQSLVIEITEGLLLNAKIGITDQLLKFRDAGIQVAIDDFGTGYSSLSYLKKFDIDYLKIDQSFVRNIATDPADMALSEAIIVMAHKLELKVIAEGVETLEQRNLLLAAGCDYGQGYLFSKPLPPEEFGLLLKNGLNIE